MGNYETHDLAPVRDDERKELNLSRKVTYKQFCKVQNIPKREDCLVIGVVGLLPMNDIIEE